jgi:hypothetical protein
MIRSVEIADVDYMATEVLIELSDETTVRLSVEEIVSLYMNRIAQEREAHGAPLPTVYRAAQFQLLRTYDMDMHSAL